MSLAATYLGANGWLLEIGTLRILVDPWLRGMLSFPPGPWFLRGELGTEQPIPGDLDLLLLTQGLADHAHPTTLRLLPKDLPRTPTPPRTSERTEHRQGERTAESPLHRPGAAGRQKRGPKARAELV